MNKAYADTSFFGALFKEQDNTLAAEAWWNPNKGTVPLFFSPLNELELDTILHTARENWDRGLKKEGMTAIQAIQSKQLFLDAVNDGLLIESEMPSPSAIHAESTKILQNYAGGICVRSIDIIHLAIARLIQADTVLSFDKRQRQLAFNANMIVPPLPPDYPNSP